MKLNCEPIRPAYRLVAKSWQLNPPSKRPEPYEAIPAKTTNPSLHNAFSPLFPHPDPQEPTPHFPSRSHKPPESIPFLDIGPPSIDLGQPLPTPFTLSAQTHLLKPRASPELPTPPALYGEKKMSSRNRSRHKRGGNMNAPAGYDKDFVEAQAKRFEMRDRNFQQAKKAMGGMKIGSSPQQHKNNDTTGGGGADPWGASPITPEEGSALMAVVNPENAAFSTPTRAGTSMSSSLVDSPGFGSPQIPSGPRAGVSPRRDPSRRHIPARFSNLSRSFNRHKLRAINEADELATASHEATAAQAEAEDQATAGAHESGDYQNEAANDSDWPQQPTEGSQAGQIPMGNPFGLPQAPLVGPTSSQHFRPPPGLEPGPRGLFEPSPWDDSVYLYRRDRCIVKVYQPFTIFKSNIMVDRIREFTVPNGIDFPGEDFGIINCIVFVEAPHINRNANSRGVLLVYSLFKGTLKKHLLHQFPVERVMGMRNDQTTEEMAISLHKRGRIYQRYYPRSVGDIQRGGMVSAYDQVEEDLELDRVDEGRMAQITEPKEPEVVLNLVDLQY
ncbi:hypothetical protein EJ08DRAFT_698813 [Tothia fuscella]|uniref:Uncharacterized protein n=1 Tax=Tothia fuscella TaxID=1048955 RepID=A0A9P4TWY9_9PEZI|nr:hypothetical protein EJ08DRAFT_698813 [Tothia fuscella]